MNSSKLNTLVGLIEAMELKDRIKEAMTAAKMTKAAFARATKASPGAITQWLSGETKSLKAETATSIERATGYRAGWIVDGRGVKMVSESQIHQQEGITPSVQSPLTLGQITEALAGYFEAMDSSTRKMSVSLINQLADDPQDHARIAAMIELSIHSKNRKYA